jgi:transcriptional regulator with XRE-family HTH domain
MMSKKKQTRTSQGVHAMTIGTRIRELRAKKGLSQGDVEKATGLLRCYTSRVENGHTVPSLETLERFAAALGVPLYRLFLTEEGAGLPSALTAVQSLEALAQSPGPEGSEARFLLKLRTYVEQIRESDREVLLSLAKKLAARKTAGES